MTVTGPADGASQRDAQVDRRRHRDRPVGRLDGDRQRQRRPARGERGLLGHRPAADGPEHDHRRRHRRRRATRPRARSTSSAPSRGRRRGSSRFSATLVGRRIVVKLNLSAQARVRFTVLRRTVTLRPRRVVSLRRVGRPVVKVVKAGPRTVKLVPPSREGRPLRRAGPDRRRDGRRVVPHRPLPDPGAAAALTARRRRPGRSSEVLHLLFGPPQVAPLPCLMPENDEGVPR